MAEPDAPARQRGHVRDRHDLGAERLLEERERIDDPLGASGSRLLVDEISVRGVAAAAAGQHHAAGEHQIAFAMLQDQVRGHVGAEGPDDRKGRQHWIERALEADERIAMQDAGAVGEVDHGAAQAEADLGEQLIGVGERRRRRRQPAVADHHHADAASHLLPSPEIEQRRRRASEPGDDAADVRAALRARQAGVDVPIGEDEAEMIERHLGEAVDACLVGPRFLAAVVDGEDFAPHRLRPQFIAERLRDGRRRERQSAREQQQPWCEGGWQGAAATHDSHAASRPIASNRCQNRRANGRASKMNKYSKSGGRSTGEMAG